MSPTFAEREDDDPAAAPALSAAPGWLRGNGVALTVLLGLVLIGFLALAQSGIAIFAMTRFGTSFGQVANKNLPDLIAASRLSELSQSLVARAPELAAAASQTQRQGITDRLNDRLAALARVLDRIDPDASNPAQLRAVRSQLDALTTNFTALDGFVRRRIAADDAYDTVVARLPALAARVRAVADAALIGAAGEEPGRGPAMSAADRARLIAWSAAGMEGVTLMLATPGVTTDSRLERVRAQLEALVANMETSRQQLPTDLRRKVDAIHENVARFGLGDQSIFRARQAQIEAGTAIQTSLRLIQQNIDKFVDSVSTIFRAAQTQISNRAASFSRTISRFNVLIFAISVLCVIAGAAIFLYVRRAVITRLKDVQEYMRAQVEGRPAAISTKGADEISEIAKATQVFVRRIAAARDAADQARHTTEAAYEELKTAQGKLIHAEKMASLGQLTAGIAHEIKNPLNFVNNFASLSLDLVEELRETAAPTIAALGDDKRAEIDEVIATLSGNLGKIAEHGKRADNIVKSMLEHSRGATGERREVEINGLIEEALNLAYHGARAQDPSFNITLKRDFDAIPPIELAPQEMTRVFLNLFTNAFYATEKRARASADPDFKPTLTVRTRDFRDAVEIRVRDNGSGIAPEVIGKLFQPFFTTKPTGEGTGLGLSISYDIVTQQHGGLIEVDSQPDEFTEFTIRLPASPSAAAWRLGARSAAS